MRGVRRNVSDVLRGTGRRVTPHRVPGGRGPRAWDSLRPTGGRRLRALVRSGSAQAGRLLVGDSSARSGRPSPGPVLMKTSSSTLWHAGGALSSPDNLTSVSDHTDECCRRVDHTAPNLQQFRRARPEPLQDGLRLVQFGLGPFALEREEFAARTQQRKGPLREAFERRDRSRGGHVHRELLRHLLGPGPAHLDVLQAEHLDALVQEGGAAQQRLEQGDPQVGPDDREDDAGKPAPEPMSTTCAPAGTASDTTAQLIRWRSQSRSTSRGPMSPRSTPASPRNAAYRSATGSASSNTSRAIPTRRIVPHDGAAAYPRNVPVDKSGRRGGRTLALWQEPHDPTAYSRPAG